MTVTHPVALRKGRSHPSGYTYDSATYSIDDDGVIDCPEDVEEEIAEALADHYGVDAEQLLAGESDDLEPGDTICTCEPGDACHECGGNCPTVKTDGDVCGGDRPCRYHDETED